MMKKQWLLLAAVLATGITGAALSDNSVDIEQIGPGSHINVHQSGDENSLIIKQGPSQPDNGNSLPVGPSGPPQDYNQSVINDAVISQLGRVNSLTAEQSGGQNNLTTTQTGDVNCANQKQTGGSNDLNLNQQGKSNCSKEDQKGDHNKKHVVKNGVVTDDVDETNGVSLK